MERLVSNLSVLPVLMFELKLKDDDSLGLVRLKPPVEGKSSCLVFKSGAEDLIVVDSDESSVQPLI